MRQRHGKGWLPDEIQALVDAFDAGNSVAEIAHQLGRSPRAVQIRLERKGRITASSAERTEAPTPSRARMVRTPQAEQTDAPHSSDSLARLIVGIDDLASSLAKLRAAASQGEYPSSAVTAVTRAYGRYDSIVLRLLTSDAAREEDSDLDPPPDRLREALIGLVRACVRERKRRFIALQLLGLDDDDIPPTMATLANKLDRSRERVRQLRNSALKQVTSKLSLRTGSATRLRTVLKNISPDTDWTKPTEAAPLIVRLATDNIGPAELLTFICCRVAGANVSSEDLRDQCVAAIEEAANDPALQISWRFDRWEEVQAKAIFLTHERFESPPPDLIGRKRTPDRQATTALDIESTILGRTVLCESVTERRVYMWLEQSSDVRWYQEQPARLRYKFGGRERPYYPDVAVMSAGGQVVVVEVKPVIQMYRHRTLAKADAAIRHFGARGIGFLLVDGSGRTLADLASHPYSPEVADGIEKLLSNGPVPFGQIHRELVRLEGHFDYLAFVSMVVNRDWGVTESPGVRVFKLGDELSFQTLRHGS